jgi:hypothetical protein
VRARGYFFDNIGYCIAEALTLETAGLTEFIPFVYLMNPNSPVVKLFRVFKIFRDICTISARVQFTSRFSGTRNTAPLLAGLCQLHFVDHLSLFLAFSIPLKNFLVSFVERTYRRRQNS